MSKDYLEITDISPNQDGVLYTMNEDDQNEEDDIANAADSPMIGEDEEKLTLLGRTSKYSAGPEDENSAKNALESDSGEKYMIKLIKNIKSNEAKAYADRGWWQGSKKKMLILLIAVVPFYLLFIGMAAFLIVDHSFLLSSKPFANFGTFNGKALNLNISNCTVYITDYDSNGQSGIASLQKPRPWKLNNDFNSTYKQSDTEISINISNDYPIDFCNLTLFIAETDSPSSLMLACEDICSLVQVSNALNINGKTSITGDIVYGNIAHLKTDEFDFKAKEGFLQINMIHILTNDLSTIAFTTTGDIIVQSDKTINIENFESPTQTFCFGGPTINMKTKDCYVDGEENTVNLQNNKNCGGEGEILDNAKTNAQKFKLSTVSGNLYVNVIPEEYTPLPNTSTIFRSHSYTNGLNFDHSTSQHFQKFLKLANSSKVNDPMVILNIGSNQAAWSSSFTKWVIASNPAYETFKPWAVAGVSAGLLTAYNMEIETKLLPGLCPWRPTLNTQDLYSISTFLDSQKGSLEGSPVFIYNVDPTAQDLENYVQSSGISYPDNDWIPWRDEWYAIAENSDGELAFYDQKLSADIPILIALILSFITALLVSLVATSFTFYFINVITYTIISKGNIQIIYSKLLSFGAKKNNNGIKGTGAKIAQDITIDISNAKKNSNIATEPTRTIDPITNLTYLWNNLIYVSSYFDYIVVALSRMKTNSLVEFFDALIIQNDNDINNNNTNDSEDDQLSQDQIDFDELENLYQKYCFLNYLKEKPFEEESISKIVKKKGFTVIHDYDNSIVFVGLTIASIDDPVKLTKSDLEMDSLSLFMKYHAMITPFDEDKVSESVFKSTYEEFCQYQNLQPVVISPQLMQIKYNVSSSELPIILIRRDDNDKNSSSMIISRKNVQIILDYLSYNKNALSYQQKKAVENILYFSKGLVYDFLNITLQYVFILLLIFPIIMVLILISTSYAPYSLKNPVYLLTWEAFIYQPSLAFTHIPYPLQIFFLILIVLNSADFITYVTYFHSLIQLLTNDMLNRSMKRPIEVYFRDNNLPTWKKIIVFINWIMIMVLIFLYFIYAGLILVWTLLGAIINPNYFLPYAAATGTFLTFISTKFTEFKETLENGFKKVMAIIEKFYQKFVNIMILKLGISLIKEHHTPFKKAAEIIQNPKVKQIMQNVSNLGIMPKDALKAISKKIDDTCTSSDGHSIPPIIAKIDQNPTFIEDEFNKLANDIEAGFLNMLKAELESKKVPKSLIGMIKSYCLKDIKHLKGQTIEFLGYLEQNNLVPSDAITFLKAVLFPTSSTLNYSNLKLLAKDMLNIITSRISSSDQTHKLTERLISCYSSYKYLLKQNWERLRYNLHILVNNNSNFNILAVNNQHSVQLIWQAIEFVLQNLYTTKQNNDIRAALLKIIKILGKPNIRIKDPNYNCMIKYFGDEYNLQQNNYIHAAYDKFYNSSKKLISLLKKNELIIDIPTQQTNNDSLAMITNSLYSHIDYTFWIEKNKMYSTQTENIPNIAAPFDIALYILRKEISNISSESISHMIKEIFQAKFQEVLNKDHDIDSYLSEDYGRLLFNIHSCIMNTSPRYLQNIENFKNNDITHDFKEFVTYSISCRYIECIKNKPMDISNQNIYYMNLLKKGKVKSEILKGLIEWLLDISSTVHCKKLFIRLIDSLKLSISHELSKYLQWMITLFTSKNQSKLSYVIYKFNLPLERFFYVGKELLPFNMLNQDDFNELLDCLNIKNKDERDNCIKILNQNKGLNSLSTWKRKFNELLSNFYVINAKTNDPNTLDIVMKLNAYMDLEADTNEGFKKVISAIIPPSNEILSLIQNDKFYKAFSSIIGLKILMPIYNNKKPYKQFERRFSSCLIKFGTYVNIDGDFLQNMYKLFFIDNIVDYKQALLCFNKELPPYTDDLISYIFSQFMSIKYNYNTIQDMIPKYLYWTDNIQGNKQDKIINIKTPLRFIKDMIDLNNTDEMSDANYNQCIQFINDIMKTSTIFYEYAQNFDNSLLKKVLSNLSILNWGLLSQRANKSQSIINKYIELLTYKDGEVNLSTFIQIFTDKKSLICTSLVIYGILKGWGSKYINLNDISDPSKKTRIRYKELAMIQLNNGNNKDFRHEFFDIFPAILKKDIHTFVESCSDIIKLVKNKSHYDKELVISFLSFMNGQFYNFTPISKALGCPAELLEFCASLYQLKNTQTRTSCIKYLETSVVCDKIFNKLGIQTDEFLAIMRMIYFSFDETYKLEDSVRKIDPKSFIDIQFLNGVVNLYQLNCDPTLTLNKSIHFTEKTKKKLSTLFVEMGLDIHIATLAMSLKIGNFLILETHINDLDWVFGKVDFTEKKKSKLPEGTKLLVHMTEGLCGVINKNVKYSKTKSIEANLSLEYAIQVLCANLIFDHNWVDLALKISLADRTPLNIPLELNDDHLMKVCLMFNLMNTDPTLLDFLCILDWNASFIYFFKYDINNKVTRTTYLEILANQVMAKDVINILIVNYKKISKILHNIYVLNDILHDENNFQKHWKDIICNILIEIFNTQTFTIFFEGYCQAQKKGISIEKYEINSFLEQAIKSDKEISEILEEFQAKFDHGIVTALLTSLLPYYYEKNQKINRKKNHNLFLVMPTFAYLDLSIITGVVNLRNSENSRLNYPLNVFNLNLLMTHIERKLIFIDGDATRIYRKFSFMKIVGLAKGILIPNVFELILSPPVYDSFDIREKTFYAYKSRPNELEKLAKEAKDFMSLYNINDKNFSGNNSSKGFDFCSEYHLRATYADNPNITAKQVIDILKTSLDWQQLNTNAKKYSDLLNLYNNELPHIIESQVLTLRQSIMTMIESMKKGKLNDLINKLMYSNKMEEREKVIKKQIMQSSRFDQGLILYSNFDYWLQKTLIEYKKGASEDDILNDDKVCDTRTGLNYRIISGKFKDFEIELMKPNLKLLMNLYDFCYDFKENVINTLGKDFLMDHGPEIKYCDQVAIGLISYLKNEASHEEITDLLPGLDIDSDQKNLADLILFLTSHISKNLDCLKVVFDVPQKVLDFMNMMMKTNYYRQDNLKQKNMDLEDFVPPLTKKFVHEFAESEESIILLLYALYNLNYGALGSLVDKCVIQDSDQSNAKNPIQSFLYSLLLMINFEKLNNYLDSEDYLPDMIDFLKIPEVFIFSVAVDDPKDALICEIFINLAKYMPTKLPSNVNNTQDKVLTSEQKYFFFVCRALNRAIECQPGEKDSNLLDIFFTDYANNIQKDYKWEKNTVQLTDDQLADVYNSNLKAFVKIIKNKDSNLDSSYEFTSEESYDASLLSWLLYMKNDQISNLKDSMSFINAIFKNDKVINNPSIFCGKNNTNDNNNVDDNENGNEGNLTSLNKRDDKNIRKHYILSFISWIKGDIQLFLNSIDKRTPAFAILSSAYIIFRFPDVLDYYFKKSKDKIIFKNSIKEDELMKLLTNDLRPITLVFMPFLKLIEANYHGSTMNISNPDVNEWVKMMYTKVVSVKSIISAIQFNYVENLVNNVDSSSNINYLNFAIFQSIFKKIDRTNHTLISNSDYYTFQPTYLDLNFENAIDPDYEAIYLETGNESSISNGEVAEDNKSQDSAVKTTPFYDCIRAIYCGEDFFLITWPFWSDKKPQYSNDWLYLNQFLLLGEHYYGKSISTKQLRCYPLSCDNEKLQLNIAEHIVMLQNLIRNSLGFEKPPIKIKTEMFSDLLVLVLEQLCNRLTVKQKDSEEFLFIEEIIKLYSAITGCNFIGYFESGCGENSDCKHCNDHSIAHLPYHMAACIDKLLDNDSLDELILPLSTKKESFKKLMPLLLGIKYGKSNDTWDPDLGQALYEEINDNDNNYDSDDDEGKYDDNKFGENNIKNNKNINGSRDGGLIKANDNNDDKVNNDIRKKPDKQEEFLKYSHFTQFSNNTIKLLDMIISQLPKDITIENKFLNLLDSMFKIIVNLYKEFDKAEEIIKDKSKANGFNVEKINELPKIVTALYKFKQGNVDYLGQLIESVTEHDKDKARNIIEYVKDTDQQVDLQSLKSLMTIPSIGLNAHPKIQETKKIISKVQNGSASQNDLFRLFDSSGNGTLDYDEFGLLASRLGIPLSDHKIRELFSAVQSDDITPDNLELDIEEFGKALLYLKEQQILKVLESIGITGKDLFSELAYLAVVLIILFVFIFVGMRAFTVGGTFSAIINSILPGLGALSLKGKDKKEIFDKIDEIEKECKKVVSKVLTMHK